MLLIWFYIHSENSCVVVVVVVVVVVGIWVIVIYFVVGFCCYLSAISAICLSVYFLN
jgi:hypothetical protein